MDAAARRSRPASALASWNGCQPGLLGRVHATGGTLLVAANEHEALRDLRATPLGADGTRGEELPLKKVGRLHSLPWPRGAVAVELRVAQGCAAKGRACRFAAGTVMPTSGGKKPPAEDRTSRCSQRRP